MANQGRPVCIADVGACSADRGGNLALRQLVSSGEALSWDLLRGTQEALPNCRILNLYGCTEAAGDSLCFDASTYIPPEEKSGSNAHR